jgi:DNA-binding response OmpR family regulator
MNRSGKSQQHKKVRTIRVLIVDDEYVHAEHSFYALSDGGWGVDEFACDPEQAVAQMSRHAPDIVLLDICFPCGTRGFDLLSAMRRKALQRGLTSPFVVFLTGVGDAATRAEAAAVPGSLYLEKPVSDEVLNRAVAEAAARLPAWRAQVEAERACKRDPKGESKSHAGEASRKTQWSDELNAERFALLEKKHKGGLGKKEQLRLDELQRQQTQWLREHSSLDTSRAEKALQELKARPEHTGK